MTAPQAVPGSVVDTGDATVEISSLPKQPTVELADDATVEIPMPQRVLRVVGSGWGLIQGHRDSRSLIPRRSLRQLVEGLAALCILVALSPVLIVVALAVKWTSPGPILFRQERLGLHRSTFKIIKFRTMSNKNSDAQHREFVKKMLTTNDDVDGGEQGVYKLVNDPRITPIGGFLRRTSIDELPQLWNVVRGEMSLVGPRPVLAWEADLFPPEAERRFAARPGMTGLWQVSGRSTLDFKAALDLDVVYVENKSLWYDIKILCRTVGVVFNRSVAR
ncbi:sugar transferase [Dactylosporangium sp. AC04546]|uniref:sugar transferase n=1 Tax=Dactylosporangium sp. AC04546 TaxID=2862460 RepID=UPI001EDCD885|nr:sugar transferase [Dactylosporangium sp. AC04546]WVK85095.1 sugar transferase [Dactylosporangium sp. AC04546]